MMLGKFSNESGWKISFCQRFSHFPGSTKAHFTHNSPVHNFKFTNVEIVCEIKVRLIVNEKLLNDRRERKFRARRGFEKVENVVLLLLTSSSDKIELDETCCDFNCR